MSSANNNIQRKESLSEELEAQNLLRLKTFSKSLEDLTSETLYSKWKRGRASLGKHAGKRGRSASLITVPEMIKEEKETEERSRKNSFYDLQEVLRPRFWSTGGIYEENESEAMADLGNLLPGTQSRCCRSYNDERNYANCLGKENHVEVESEVLIAKPVSVNGLCRPCTIRPTNSPLPNRKPPAMLAPELPKRGGSPVIVQALGDREMDATRGILREKILNNSRTEVALFVPPKRRMSSPASSGVLAQSKVLPEQMTQAINGVGRECAENSTSGHNEPQLRPDKEGERASLRMYYTTPGCTAYAIVSQPLQTAKSANVLENTSGRIASENGLMDTLAPTHEGQQILKRLSRASSFNEGARQRAQSSEGMVRRLSVESRRVTRPTAQDLLSNIANASRKTEKDRLRDIEDAFDWVRKELADLRAQDKDIMRMFNKIQAGIRQIQMDRSLSESSENSFEEEYGNRYNTISTSMSTSYMPLLKEINDTYENFPRRRASLIWLLFHKASTRQEPKVAMCLFCYAFWLLHDLKSPHKQVTRTVYLQQIIQSVLFTHSEH